MTGDCLVLPFKFWLTVLTKYVDFDFHLVLIDKLSYFILNKNNSIYDLCFVFVHLYDTSYMEKEFA